MHHMSKILLEGIDSEKSLPGTSEKNKTLWYMRSKFSEEHVP